MLVGDDLLHDDCGSREYDSGSMGIARWRWIAWIVWSGWLWKEQRIWILRWFDRSYGGYGSTGGYSSSVGYGSSGGFSSSYRSASTGTLTMMSSSSVARPISQLKSMAAQSTVVGLPIQLTVEVPNDAKVFVNDRPTTSLGVTREFTSRNLEQGKQYDFRVRAEMMNKDGKWVSETQQTSMRAGESEALRFTFPDEPQLLVTSQND